MERVNVQCDRCKKMVDGIEDTYSTGGFYRITKGDYWEKFANDGEKVICNQCMFTDERYIQKYGKHFD
jgi:hypothetical protein